MSVFLSDTEIGNLVIFLWESTEIGDVVDNTMGISFEHPTILALGSVQVDIAGRSPMIYTAPPAVTLILPINTPYTFTILEPGFLFCVYNKLEPGAVEEVANIRSGMLKLFS